MSELTLWNEGIVGATFALYILIGLWARAATTADFYVAGRRAGAIANGIASASLVPVAGLLALDGYRDSPLLMGWTGGYLLLALLLAPYLRGLDRSTVPEIIGDRYGSKLARLIALLVLILICGVYVVGQLSGIGVAISRFFDISDDIGLSVGVAIVALYAVLGGMNAITRTQIAQSMLLILACAVPAAFISLQLTGQPLPQIGLGAPLAGDPAGLSILDRIDWTLTELGFAKYTTSIQGEPLNMLALTLSLMLGTASLPHLVSRFFTTPSVRSTRYAAAWALAFIAILSTTVPAVGGMARGHLLTSVQSLAAGSEEGSLRYDDRPAWFKRWEIGGQIRFEDKNGDGRIQYYDEANAGFAEKAARLGWKGNELTIADTGIMTLANPELAKLPIWIIALIIAGVLGAALATSAGLLLVIAAAISRDLLKGVVLTRLPEKGELIVARIAIIAAAALAGYLATNPPGFAADTVVIACGLSAAALFPAIVMGIFSRRINGFGAASGMLAGTAVTLLYILQHTGVFHTLGADGLMADAGLGPNWFFGIRPEAFGVIGALVNAAVAVLMSKITAPPPSPIQDLITSARTPAGKRAPSGG